MYLPPRKSSVLASIVVSIAISALGIYRSYQAGIQAMVWECREIADCLDELKNVRRSEKVAQSSQCKLVPNIASVSARHEDPKTLNRNLKS